MSKNYISSLIRCHGNHQAMGTLEMSENTEYTEHTCKILLVFKQKYYVRSFCYDKWLQ